MSNNRFKKILAVALLSTMGLVACGNEIKAKPSNYDDELVSFTDSNDEIYHNLVSIIEDAYRDGSLASAVLDKVLYQYSVSVFGRYNRIAEPYNLGEDEITLKEAAASASSADKTKADTFIEKHKAFWTTDSKGDRQTDDDSKAREYARVIAKWNTIEDRIARTFYGSISGGSYNNDRGYFSEKKFLAELRSQLHKVANPYAASTVMTKESYKVVITPEVQEEDVFTTSVPTADSEVTSTTYLHRANYQDPKAWDLAQVEEKTDDTLTYVEDEIIPTIYRSLLVEQYLFDESYNNLGRSAARKVNIVAISENSNNVAGADYLMKYFVRNVISVKDANITLANFKAVSEAAKGFIDNGSNDYLEGVMSIPAYAGAFPKETFTGYDGESYTYYKGTDYGDMMANFAKIKDNINTTDASVESDFTGSYTYNAAVGKEMKENDIRKKDYTTDGWYIKSNGVGDLPDSIKSRLFNIGVANILDNKDKKDDVDVVRDRFESATYTVYPNESKLVAKINGKYYLKKASKQAGADPMDDILFYESGKYYVIQIEEAVSGSKLAKESTKYEADRKEEILNEVARIIADNDTYQTSSTKHWLEKAAIKYHDQKIYDYFKDNYPDLFD